MYVGQDVGGGGGSRMKLVTRLSWENRRPCTRLSEVFEVRLQTFPSLLRSKISIFFGDGANSCLLRHSRGEYVDSRLGSIRSFHVSIVREPGVLKSSRLF